MSDICCLYGEPDLLANIFLNLGVFDLLSVELVSKDWRNFVMEEGIWRRKLKHKEKTSNWKFTLQQHDCSSLDPLAAKKLYFHVSSVIISNTLGMYKENSTLVLEQEQNTKQSSSLSKFQKEGEMEKTKKSEEDLFFEKKYKTHETMFKSMPKTIVFYNEQSQYLMSKLMVFGATSFPILETKSGAIVMAGSYYGKGRVVVLPHETILANTRLMQGAADWASGSHVSSVETCNIAADPTSKAWSRDGWVYIQVGKRTLPFNDIQFVKRQNILTSKPSVYITRSHYDDNADNLLTYVRNGGGLIIGGHAWFWASQNPMTSLLLNHTGNKFLSNFGIAFSDQWIDHNDAKFPIETTKIPSMKASYYFVAQQRSIGLNCQHQDEDLYHELHLFKDELEIKGEFEDIIQLNKKAQLYNQ
eukprot:GFUD01032249.1.p1 GENE.GFUD01032249.1~~GFUD01032249.1.p1  ORF type:complete len:415 (+),score=73.98 GFUD01032249.1:56-1300(+)